MCQLGFCVDSSVVWALLMAAKCSKGAADMSRSRLKRFFQANWRWIITFLGFIFRPAIEKIVLSVFSSFSEVKLLISPILWFLLFAVAAIGVTGVVVFVILPLLMKGADWLFRPAFVCTKRRRFCDLLPEVEWCLDAIKEDYRDEAASVARSNVGIGTISKVYNIFPPPVGPHVRYEALRSRLGRLFSNLDKVDVPIPDSVEIDTLGELTDMAGYLAQLHDCMSGCDLDAAREIDPP